MNANRIESNGLDFVTMRISRLLSPLFAVEILKSLDHKNIINAYVNMAGIDVYEASGHL
jgi:hypothetical protein